MDSKTKFSGAVGLTLVFFGILLYGLFSDFAPGDLYYVIQAHLVLGIILLAVFLIRGGFQVMSAAAARRAAGFGLGAAAYSLLFLGIVAAANYAAYRHDPLYYDSTESKVFTLAPQTREVLARLKEPILIRAFYVGGKVDPGVEDLLKRFQRATDKITWQAVDPEKNPALTEKLGINEKGTLHFSAAGAESTREAKIAREIGEQEVINAIIKLNRGSEKTIYMLAGHGETDLDDGTTNTGALFLKEAIQGENLQVKPLLLAQNPQVPADAAALLLSSPRRPLLAAERSALKIYLRAGGRAVMLNEPRTTRDLSELAAEFGIEVGNDVIIEKSMQLFQGPTYDAQSVITSYPPHEITKDFNQGTLFPTSSSVRKKEDAASGCAVSELAKTGRESWAETKIELVYADEPQAALETDDIRGPVPIAAAAECPSGEASGAANRAGRIVVFGDADFVNNANIRQLFNRDLFLNALNWVIGESEGITVRAKTLRRSTKALSAAQMRAIFLAGAVLLPECLVLAGFGVWWLRRSESPLLRRAKKNQPAEPEQTKG